MIQRASVFSNASMYLVRQLVANELCVVQGIDIPRWGGLVLEVFLYPLAKNFEF